MKNFLIGILSIILPPSIISILKFGFNILGNNYVIFGGLITIPILFGVFYCFYPKYLQKINVISLSPLFRIVLFSVLYIFLVITIIIVPKPDYNNWEKISICLLYAFICVSIIIIFILTKKNIKNDIGIVVSCLPVEIVNNDKNEVKIYLIKNPNHNNRWMFPGGHIEFSGVDIEKIIKDKTKEEANLTVEILEPPEKLYIDRYEVLSGLHRFTYSLPVAEDVKCCKEKGHKLHIDFGFIGKVVNAKDIKSSYRRVYVLLNLDSEISEGIIETKIDKAIAEDNKLTNAEDKIISKEIAKRIEISLNAYKKYHVAEKNIKSNSSKETPQ